MKRALLISVCAWPVVGLLLAPAARGEPYHWIAVDDYWDEGENWSDQYGNPRPGEYHQDDEMYVDKDADNVVCRFRQSDSVAYVEVTYGNTISHTAGPLTVGQDLIVGHDESYGEYQLSGSGASVTVHGRVVLGDDGYGEYQLTGSNASLKVKGNLYVGRRVDSQEYPGAIFRIASATAQVEAENIYVAQGEGQGPTGYVAGTFTHDAGVVRVLSEAWPKLVVGDEPGADAIYYLIDSDSLLEVGRQEQPGVSGVTGIEYVGRLGQGRFVHTAGTHKVWGDMDVGGCSSFGSYTMSGGELVVGRPAPQSTWGNLGVGGRDGGEFEQTGSSTVSVDINLQVGSGGGGGEYRLHAAESDLTVAGEIEIGVQNDGRFEWFAGDIATAALTVGANGTLAMGFDFNLPNLAGGALTQYQQQNSTVTLDPGTVEVTHGATCTHNSTGTVSMGSLVIGSADGAGTLEITQAGSPNIELSDSLTFASNSTFSAVSASETSIRLGGGRTGAFENENTSGSALAGLGNLTLGCLFVDEGPNKGNVLNFRLSGQRPGEELTSDDFCESNFVMNKLVVGRPSTGPEDDDYGIQVAFLDEEENKALYVNTLEIQAGARFKCVDLVLEQEVYYDKPAPKRLYMGDADLNGRVDGLDYNTWSSHYNETGSTWAHGDFNGDRVVDGLDYNIWAANYGSGWGDKGGGGPSKELVDLVQACPDGDLDSDGDIDEDDVFMLMWLEELDAQP